MASRSGSRVRVFIDGESADLVSEIRTAERAIGRFGSTTTRQSRTMDRAGRTTDTFNKRTTALGASFKTAALAAGGAVAAYVGIAQVKDAIATTTDLGKTTLGLAGNLGLTTKAASEWAAVAKARGVEGRALSQAFGTLAKSVEAAKESTSSQAQMLRRLGVSQEEIRRQNFNEVLFSVADGMRDLGPGTERTAASMRLFGRGWQTVVPLIREGSGAMQEQLDLANEYGATFSGGSIKSIKDLIQAERELELAQLGLQIQFTKLIAPALIDVFRGVAKLVGAFRRARPQITGFVRGIVASLKEFWESAGFLRSVIKTVWDAIKGIFEAGAQVIRGTVKVISGVLTGNFGRVWEGVKDIFQGGIKGAIGLLKAATAPFRRAAGAIGGALGKAFSASWDKIKSIFSDAVNWIIRNVLNRIPGVELGQIGGGKKGNVADAAAGVAGNVGQGAQTRFMGGMITAPVAIVGEEAPQHPEFVLATNPRHRQRNVQLWAQAGHELGIPGFQFGGILDTAKSIGGGIGKAISGATPLVSATNLVGRIADAPFGGLPAWLGGTAEWIRDRAVEFVRSQVSGAFTGGKEILGRFKGSTLAMARTLSEMFGLSFSSGYRSPAHNAAVGGVPGSLHTHGSPTNPGAFDLIGPLGAMRAALAFAQRKWRPRESLIHDAGSGLHLHLGFFRRGGIRKSPAGMASLLRRRGLSASQSRILGAVGFAESSGRLGAVGDGGQSHGPWQVYGPAWPQFSAQRLTSDWDYAAGAAIHILRTQGLGAWTMYNNGVYRRYLDAADPGRGARGGGRAGAGSAAAVGPGGPGGRGTGFLPDFGRIEGLVEGGRHGRALGLVERTLGRRGVSGENREVLREIRALLREFVRNQRAIMRARRSERTAINAAVAAAASGQIGGTVNLSRNTPVAGSFASY